MKILTKQVFNGIKIVLSDSTYLRIGIVSALAAANLIYWLITRTTTFPHLFVLAKNGDFGPHSYIYLTTYFISTILFIVLFGISTSLTVWLFKKSQLSKSSNAAGFTAAVIGAFAAGCPVCGAFLLSFFGLVGGLSVFPLLGLELKFLSIAFILASIIYSARKITYCIDNNLCEIPVKNDIKSNSQIESKPRIVLINRVLIYFLIVVFFTNQYLMTSIATATGMVKPTKIAINNPFKPKAESSKSILAVKINPDGKTTSVVEQPTITEVLGNPNSGDHLADARAVMLGAGSPFYAPNNLAFDDPLTAQKGWMAYENSIKLQGDLNDRYNTLISDMSCSYCCGGVNSVTRNKNCGCAHAKAIRGFFKYMLEKYNDQYTNDELLGEAHRWFAIWYPRGYLSDYLLATGNESALPHQPHGGAGPDGRHGI